MMSEKLRKALGAFAMTVMIGGPALATIGLVIVVFGPVPRQELGVAVGNIVEIFVFSLLAGGALRTLTSIDARLEQRS